MNWKEKGSNGASETQGIRIKDKGNGAGPAWESTYTQHDYSQGNCRTIIIQIFLLIKKYIVNKVNVIYISRIRTFWFYYFT